MRFSTIVAGFAIFIGVLVSPIPQKLGIYRVFQALARAVPTLSGLTPALVEESPWPFTVEHLNALDLSGQHALVTGGNSGVGYETAKALCRLGASVTIGCRNSRRCENAAERIRDSKNFSGKIGTLMIDTSSLSSVKKAATIFTESNTQLDMLFLNAGTGSVGIMPDGSAPLSEDTIEMVFATNYVGHHLLFKHLEPLLGKSPMARVVLTSSAASMPSMHTFDYKVATDRETLNNIKITTGVDLKLYGQSKLAQVLWAQELTERLGPHSNVYVNSAHPGSVDTGIWIKNPLVPMFVQEYILYYIRKHIMWSAAEGALTLLYLGVATDDIKSRNIRGKYFHPQSVMIENKNADEPVLQRKLWEFSDELVKDFL